MMTPATASTGTTLFTPISGASAAVRITPVPKPPMPPTTAAARPSAATAASVYASSSNLALDGPGPAVAIDCDVGERALVSIGLAFNGFAFLVAVYALAGLLAEMPGCDPVGKNLRYIAAYAR